MSHEPVRYADTLIFPAALDPDAVATVRRLIEAGLESYLVGGCVRDLLLGLIPKDFDVSTEARPRQIRRLFRNSRIIGRRFKLAHVHWPNGKIIEVATFRATPEGSGEPGVNTEDLLITRDNEFGNAEEDVLRRDFTINALLYDVRTAEVIDYVGGVQDLKDRLLRTIGDPGVRFAEDPVRMLRAMKFIARLELQPTPEVAAAMSASSEYIGRSSPPRVLEEIYKLMTCGKAHRALPLLVEHGLLQRLLPEIAPYWIEHLDQLAATGEALDRVDRGRRRVGNDQLLATLCLGPWLSRTREPVSDPLLVAHDLFDHAALRMSIPRRDMASLRHVLVTFSRLEQPRRTRRFRISDFLRRPVTQQAIELLYIAAQAGLVDPELHAMWAHRMVTQTPDAGAAPPPDEAEEFHDPHDPQAGRDGPRGGRRRRRRGGRRHRHDRDRPLGGETGGDRPFGPQPQPAPGELEPVGAAVGADDDDFDGDDSVVDDGAITGSPYGHVPQDGPLTQDQQGPNEGGGRRRRRRRRGRGRGRGQEGGQPGGQPGGHGGGDQPAASPESGEPATVDVAAQAPSTESDPARPAEGTDGGRRPRRRRRGGRGRSGGGGGQAGGGSDQGAGSSQQQGGGGGQGGSGGQGDGGSRPSGGGGGQAGGQGGRQGGGGRRGRGGGQGGGQGGGGGRDRGRRGGGDRARQGAGAPGGQGGGAPRKDDDAGGPVQGPGQRHPEDVEDFFDW